MENTFMTIIVVAIGIIIMFVFPLMAVAERNDDIAQQAMQTMTSEFAVKEATNGKITSDDYQDYLARIATTGNTYDVEMEVQKLDENFGKKSVVTSKDLIGENARYSIFTSDIENALKTDGEFLLNKGDILIITAKNTNTTSGEVFRQIFYKVTGKGAPQIGVSAAVTAINTGKSAN